MLRSVSRFSQKQQRLLTIALTPLECITNIIDHFYPKSFDTVVCGSDTGEFISGSPKAIFDYLRANETKYKVFYYSPFSIKGTRAKISYIIWFAPIFFKAKFLISSHTPKDFFPYSWSRKKIFINTWHGIPLKAMFFSDVGDTSASRRGILKLNFKTNAFIVSSKLEAKLIARCFRLDPKKFLYSGHPRNDCLMANLKQKGSKLLPNLLPKNVPEYKFVFLYCPTYRRDNATRFFPFVDMNFADLCDFLNKNKIIILTREHIYSKNTNEKYSDRIIPFGFNECHDVNSILAEIDALITDYSSIFADYLLLDRPCIFIPYDLESYMKKRGLLLDYHFWAAGPSVTSYSNFITALTEVVAGEDHFIDKRRILRTVFHENVNIPSSQKVTEYIKTIKA